MDPFHHLAGAGPYPHQPDHPAVRLGQSAAQSAVGAAYGTIGGIETLNGKPLSVYDSNSGNGVGHTFSIPTLGISVPLIANPSSASNICSQAPCVKVPVGAVIVSFQRGVVGQAHDQREHSRPDGPRRDGRDHPGGPGAAVVAAGGTRPVRDAGAVLDVHGAIVQARLPLVVYGCTDPKAGACDTLYQIPTDPRLNHRARVVGGVLAERCAAVLGEFFAARRREGKK